MSTLEGNLRVVQEKMAASAHRAGRDPAEVVLVAVTKTQPPSVIQAARLTNWACATLARTASRKPKPSWQVCLMTSPGT